MNNLQSHAAKDLQRLIDQIERLQSEQKGLGEDIRDKMKEAKGKGLDPKVIRKVLAIRKKGAAEHAEEEAIIATYCHALGMADTPMGDYMDRQDHLEAAE